jgi:hypothetical protein
LADRTLAISISKGLFNPAFILVRVQGALKSGNIGFTSFNVSVMPDQESPFKVDFVKSQKTMESKLQAKIKSIDSNGLMKVQFSKPLLQIANISQIAEKKALSVILVLVEPRANLPKAVSWDVTQLSGSTVTIKVNFSEPQKISNGIVSYW